MTATPHVEPQSERTSACRRAMSSALLPRPGRVTPRVLVATDLSQGADEALRQADAWARAAHAELIVAHVIADFSGLNRLVPDRRMHRRALMSTLFERARNSVERRVRELSGRTRAEFRLELGVGSPERGILSMALDCDVDLIVVGDSGAGARLKNKLCGRTAVTVMRRASVPVLVARSGREHGGNSLRREATVGGIVGRTTLAATELSDPALPVLRAAYAFATQHGQRLVMFHGADAAAAAAAAVAGRGHDSAHPLLLAARPEVIGAAEERLAAAATSLGVTEATLRIAVRGAARDILATAADEGAALIVVGAHGSTRRKPIAFGSVAEGVARSAQCSVLVVRLTDGT